MFNIGSVLCAKFSAMNEKLECLKVDDGSFALSHNFFAFPQNGFTKSTEVSEEM